MTISGKRFDISKEDMITAGIRMDLKKHKCAEIIDQIVETLSGWRRYAECSDINQTATEEIESMLLRKCSSHA